jgi:hypothetical protein
VKTALGERDVTENMRKKTPQEKKQLSYQEQQLVITSLKLDDDLAEQIDSRLYQKAPKIWSKVADAPLKKMIEHKLQRRLELEKQGGRRAAKKSVGNRKKVA